MADPNDAYARLVNILIGPLGVDFALISPDATLSDLQLDSLAAEEFVLLVAEEFGGDGSAPYELAEVPLAELAARLGGTEPTAAGPIAAGLGGAESSSGVGRVSG
ncbi:acyl carrier protein [Streptomyces sp. NBC_00435]|uniref:acyl carrier protein n=1 Tax=Streptomyces sp. NBC_00435 TaxID=2903649 RepID=UPI002E23A4FF